MHVPFFPPYIPPWPAVVPPPLPKEVVQPRDLSNEDVVELLSDSEAQEFTEFDPAVEPQGMWDPPTAMASFLERHFNHSLSEKEKEAIMTDFPRPNCSVLQAPQLDDLVKEQLKKKGKDPQFGAERTLYKVQQQLLEVSGPLTCLWADLLNPDAEVSAEEVLALIQRALVLLGSASHGVSQERRKIACSRINPKLKALASEDFTGRENKLFGPGFLEKASKRIDSEKAMDKMSEVGPSKKRRYDNDKGDLLCFLSGGAPAKHDGRGNQRPAQSCNSQKPQNRSRKVQFKGPQQGPQNSHNARQ